MALSSALENELGKHLKLKRAGMGNFYGSLDLMECLKAGKEKRGGRKHGQPQGSPLYSRMKHNLGGTAKHKQCHWILLGLPVPVAPLPVCGSLYHGPATQSHLLPCDGNLHPPQLGIHLKSSLLISSMSYSLHPDRERLSLQPPPL
ncbi:hypothetical protein XENTR_v10004441 [Xenopus tropicalis]|nr:hypothetical protein XENTR_v10004441 [Xenopus tropicalis]